MPVSASPLLTDLGAAVRDVAERAGPSVVALGRRWAPGGGVVVAPGRVVTVAHAVRGDEPVVTFADGRRAEGRVAGVDRDSDLAVVEVETGDAPALASAPGDAAPGLGAPVIALARGGTLRATLGFVSIAERSMRGPRGRRLTGVIEHTAPLPRGASGAPLVDAEGRLVGLNAVRLDGGLILAVPAPPALVERLARGERIAPRRLGVALAPARVAARMRRAVGLPERDGLLVRGVKDGTPAAAAGLQRGDLIVAVADRPTPGLDELHAALEAHAEADTLELTVVRGVDEQRLSVTFASQG